MTIGTEWPDAGALQVAIMLELVKHRGARTPDYLATKLSAGNPQPVNEALEQLASFGYVDNHTRRPIPTRPGSSWLLERHVPQLLAGEPDGMAGAAIVKWYGLDVSRFRPVVSMIADKGRIVRTGRARGTRYYHPDLAPGVSDAASSKPAAKPDRDPAPVVPPPGQTPVVKPPDELRQALQDVRDQLSLCADAVTVIARHLGVELEQ